MNKKEQLIEKIMKDIEENVEPGEVSLYSVRFFLEKHLPEDNEGDVIEIVKKCKQNHIWLNAMQSKEDKIKQLGTEILRQLESREHTKKETLGLTDMLYVSINQS